MIVIVAPYPISDKQKDGMFQRIMHIDTLMESLPRVYLELYFFKHFRKDEIVEGLVTILKFNIFTHFFRVATLIKKADILYIHSAYNAVRLMLFSTKAHIIFDAHGVVPEELVQEGRITASKIYSLVERQILRRCNTLICVTNTMLVHLRNKYGDCQHRQHIILPILPRLDHNDQNLPSNISARDSNSVIYAGGIQSWQNIDKMLAAARMRPDMKYTFLTGNTKIFKGHLSGIGLKDVSCFSVAPEAVQDYYLNHEYGFILRDEILLNRVACPTKLVEYLYWGVLPIVITPHIGDFTPVTLDHITLEQFSAGDLPNQTARSKMREHNRHTVMSMLDIAKESQNRLQSILSRGA